ncbi:type VII secretion target [Gordonia sp. NPDC003950]
MDVNPEALRQFSASVTGLADRIPAAPMPADLAAVADCLPGSSTQYSAATAAEAIGEPLRAVARYFQGVADAVYTAAGTYEVADDALAARFRSLAGASE